MPGPARPACGCCTAAASPAACRRRKTSSREIHNHVTAAAHSGSSIYTLDQALLERLEPDLILTQELCEVRAISYEEVAKAVHRLDVALPGTRTVLSLEPQTLAGILEAIR